MILIHEVIEILRYFSFKNHTENKSKTGGIWGVLLK